MSKIGLLEEALKTGGGLLGEAGGYVKDLMFLHNTNSDKIARQQSMGGMPSPSIAVTKKDIPLEGFGDITLVGKPSNFDPSNKDNILYDADAYTARGPRPVKFAKKNAAKQFEKDYMGIDQGEWTNQMEGALRRLGSKSNASEQAYDQIVSGYAREVMPLSRFAESRGVKLPMDGNRLNYRKAREYREKNSAAYEIWSNNEINKYLEPQEYFVTNPNHDRVTGKPRFKPYTADEVTKYMNKQGGKGAEQANASVGKLRAETTSQLKSLDAARSAKGSLTHGDEMYQFKADSEQIYENLRDDFRGIFKGDSRGGEYLDSFGEMIIDAEKSGLDYALRVNGFGEATPALKTEVMEYRDMLRNGPTEYFESKPKRVVDFSEFSGAIVPKNTNKETIGLLKEYGLKVKKYSDEDGRLAARDKFKSEMFSNPAAGAGAAGLGLLAMGASDDSEAGVVGKAAKGVLDMATPARMARAKDMGFDTDTTYYHGTRRDFEEFEPMQPVGILGNSKGVYFTKDKRTAEEYAMDVDGAMDERSRIIEARLKDPILKPSNGYSGDEYIIQDPSNIRSIYAKFDPANSQSSSLTASNPAAGVGAGVLGAIVGQQPQGLMDAMAGRDALLSPEELSYLKSKQKFNSNFSDDTGYERGDILPFRTNQNTGDTELATPQMLKGLLEAFMTMAKSLSLESLIPSLWKS